MKPIKTAEEFAKVLREAEREHFKKQATNVSLEILEKHWPKKKEA